jgi:catechol 2,3-dioxygenase-like lactoylglutathione lyase family enzyme
LPALKRPCDPWLSQNPRSPRSAELVRAGHRGAFPSKRPKLREEQDAARIDQPLAFHVEKREQVDQVHVLVKQLGAEILDGPAEFPYEGPDGWYAVYFFGPDRLKFEVVHMPAAEKAYIEAMHALERGTSR